MRNISPVAGKKRSFFYWPCYVLFWYHPKIIKPSPIIDFSQTFSHYPQLHSWKPTTSGRTAHRLKPSWRRKSHHSVEAGYIAAKCRDRNLPKIWPRFNFFRMFPRGLSLLGGSVAIKWKTHLQKTSAIVFTHKGGSKHKTCALNFSFRTGFSKKTPNIPEPCSWGEIFQQPR